MQISGLDDSHFFTEMEEPPEPPTLLGLFDQATNKLCGAISKDQHQDRRERQKTPFSQKLGVSSR